jgi:hypothetical protein
MFERAKTVRTLDRAATVIATKYLPEQKCFEQTFKAK